MAVVNLKTEEFEKFIQDHPMVILDFWAEWCGPCKMFAPIFEKVAEKHPDVAFAKVNVEEEQQLAAMFQVRSIPTVAFMREGIVVYAQPGMMPEEMLEEGIQQMKNLDMDQVRAELEKAQQEQQQG
ncbi:thioredoxin [Sulfurivirga sp.]|uniref:thioredoxin n=1 Tax=Sulfurivirga sp. TaxID=2614236 RepID=UPI0025F85B4F|nr:thioredoxin [Sulfurivirga sp.]